MNRRIFQNIFSKRNRYFFIFGFCIFLLNQPYFVWSIQRFQLFMFLPVIVISLFYLKRNSRRDVLILLAFSFVLIYQVGGSNIFGYLNSLIFLIFLLTTFPKESSFLRRLRQITSK